MSLLTAFSAETLVLMDLGDFRPGCRADEGICLGCAAQQPSPWQGNSLIRGAQSFQLAFLKITALYPTN